MLKLYGSPPMRILRVLWALHELDLRYERVPVDLMAGEGQRPDFLRLNTTGKVPVLIDGDFVLTESVAIVLYLAEKHPVGGLLPTDVRQRAEAYRWVLFATTELEQPLWRIARHSLLYPEQKRSPADIALAREDFHAMAIVLDRHMEGRSFIVGDRFGIADCVTAYLMDWANEVGLIETLPNLRAYLEHMYARPTAPVRIAAAMEADA